jgi:hypothetical protein
MHVYRSINNKLVHTFQLQKSIIIYLVYICCNFFNKCIFFQVEKSKYSQKFEKIIIFMPC